MFFCTNRRSPKTIRLTKTGYTYIISHYNSSVTIIDLVSRTNYNVYVLFLYISGGTSNLKSIQNDRFFWKTYHCKIIYSQSSAGICWVEIAEEILFVFRFDVWPGTRTLAFRLISQHKASLICIRKWKWGA